ncbi:prefoldin subunit 3 [Planococcus citri]|uniref:prefoldin subunit 3 n=1 Tax=Planococcus citri TaxID=170843 RepID=UPI0031F99210
MGDEEKKSSGAGIPQAIFVEDVDSFMAQPENGGNAEKVLRKLDEQHNKYKFMELNLLAKKKRLKNQMPDLEKSLDMIHLLKKRKAEASEEKIMTEFLLSEQLYSKAVIKPSDTVYLWLGANVMLEYSLDDAAELLTKNIETAKKQEASVEQDLDFLRDQFTTTEVNMARVYNWDVKRRQAESGST